MSLLVRNAFRPVTNQNIPAQKGPAGKNLSKIPVFQSRIPTAATKENQVVGAKTVQGKVGGGRVALTTKTKPTTPLVKAKPVIAKKAATVDNIDKDTNCFLLSEYAPDIYKYLRQVEKKQCLEENFLASNSIVKPQMRAILIDWLISVHSSFHLSGETIYICVAMIDRYFARKAVPKKNIQLVGVTALFIASKYEEIYYPEIGEFVNICDKLYTKRDIIRMELDILGTLKFELGRPLPLHFLRRGSKAAHANGKTHILAKYLCELSLTDYSMAHWDPSLLAATALYLSLRMIDLESNGGTLTISESMANDNVWNATLEHYTGYSRADVLKHAPVLARTICNAETSKYQHCRKKYSSSKCLEIAKYPQLSCKLIKRLAASAPTPLF